MPTLNKSFSVSNANLELDASCEVQILPGDSDRIEIVATGEQKALDDLVVTQSRDGTVVIKQSHTGSNVTIIGNSVSIGGSINQSVINTSSGTYINSSSPVWINGKRVDTSQFVDDTSTSEPTTIKVYVPTSLVLDADLDGVANLEVHRDVVVEDLNLDISGSAKCRFFAVRDASIDASGVGEVMIVGLFGDLNLDVSGTARIGIDGDYSSVKVDASGMAKVVTGGKCRGDYKVNASGMSSITHTGQILGRRKEKTSGMCSINI